jgi:uncharacterized membrane protein YhdT
MVFAAVFVIVWFGAAAVTVNAQLLGGTISFFQSVCILGYCVFPLTLSAMGCFIMSFIYKSVRTPYLLVINAHLTNDDIATDYHQINLRWRGLHMEHKG